MARDLDNICWSDNLRLEYFNLAENLDLPVILEHMKAHEGLTERQVDDIRSHASPRDRVTSLLDAVKDAPKHGREVFIEGLKETNQEHLAALITGD